MGNDLASLLEQMERNQGNVYNDMNNDTVQPMQGLLGSGQGGLQAMQQMMGKTSNAAQNMAAQGQQQTQVAMQGKNALMNQMDSQAAQTQQQAMQAAQQQQQQGGGLGKLLRLGIIISSAGGAGAAEGATASLGENALANSAWQDMANKGMLSWL